MPKVLTDNEKCIGCGLCVSDCVTFSMSIENNKVVHDDAGCILCGHCEAICPKGAVILEGFDDEIEEIDEQKRLNPDELTKAIKQRRTIRQFTAQKVPDEIIDKIIETGRITQTGTNAQKVSYIVLKDKIGECEKAASCFFQKMIKIGRVFAPPLKKIVIDDNYFFKKAGLAIIILGEDKVSASLATQNMSLMAESYGLGVLYSGFFTIAYNSLRRIRKILGTKKKPKAVTTLVIGYPAVKYHRTVHRNKANVIYK